jgi:nickel-dependent lactate racemase
MKYQLSFGRSSGNLVLREEPRLGHFVGPARSSDEELRDEVRRQLENPIDAPALHRACTSDDRVAVVLDAGLPYAVDILVPLFECLCHRGGVSASNISVIYDGSEASGQVDQLIDELPDEWADVQMVEHHPASLPSVAYLASTSGGRRVYLCRGVVDADFYLVVSRIGFDPVQGRRGPSGLLFPTMSNEETRLQARRTAMESRLSPDHLFHRQDSPEVAQLAGLFYSIGVCVGADGAPDRVWVGRYDAVEREGDQYVDEHWRVDPPNVVPDLVIAVCSPRDGGSSWEDLALALVSATRLYKFEMGAVAVVSDLSQSLGPATSILRGENESWTASQRIRESESSDAVTAWQLAQGVGQARVYLLSKLENEVVESMGMVPLASLHELENLSKKASKVVLIENADRFDVTMARSAIYRPVEDSDDDEDE